ncbi:MAG: hypothetical protein LBU64_09245 [Planctomycetota bacterium]|jgi:hypothetical protein|nr:hypothetical protein [Planctomycetota bacterium]
MTPERLADFARSLLSWRGALVDWPDGAPEGLAILPAGVAAQFGVPEETRLSAEPGEGRLAASLATDFLERAEPLLADASPAVTWRLRNASLKKASSEETVAKAFDWLNARVRVRGGHAAEVEYHRWFFRAELVSEDKWEDVVAVTLNSRTGVGLELPDLAGGDDGEWLRKPPPPADSQARAAGLAWDETLRRAAAFLDRMDGKLMRDRERLRNYYGALLKEKKRFRTAPESEEARAKKEERSRIVRLELERKTQELGERYSIRARLTPIGLLRLALPALAIDLSVRRKQDEGVRTVYWNSVLKVMEPLACSRCGRSCFAVAFTDCALEPLCPECLKEERHA